MIPAQIFREYDIRGLADSELTSGLCEGIGRAFGSALIEEKGTGVRIGVSWDLRPSSARLRKALIEGITAAGANVVELGLLPTPLLYFSVSHLKLHAGISITGSHNPPEYNGFKFHLADRSFFGREIQGLRKKIEEGARAQPKGKGKIEKAEIVPAYMKTVAGLFKFKRKIKVVIDSGHGMGGMVAPDLVKSFGHEVIELYSNLNPNFPDHHPDPSELKNLRDVQKKVHETKADLGIAFDGDADRIGVVDEKGEVIPGDKILLLYAREVLTRKPGATIIGDVKCSQIIYDDIAKRGGKPIMWKTGHSLIKAKIKETHAELAGEMSGHMFFVDRWFGFDDAIYAACRFLEILDKDPRPLSQHLADLPKLHSTPELRVDCPDEIKFDVVRRAVENFKEKFEVIDTDGARVIFSDGWGLVRASNTQPVLVMRFEATSESRLREIQQLIENEIKSIRKSF